MGYSSEFGKNAASGGPFPDGPKGNTKRPQSYTGKYTSDGKPQMGPQAFRKELPPARTSADDPMTSEANGAFDNSGPTFDNILKKWRTNGCRKLGSCTK